MSRSLLRPLVLFVASVSWFACTSGATPVPQGRVPGQSDFVSAAPMGGAASRASDAGAGAVPAPSTTTPSRTVEETDIYRLDGDRLYVLNSYRGLLAFDVSNVDAPIFLGRAPILGWPVEMIVRDGFAHVVVSDWYGVADDGSPFHGSIVRSFDVHDPSHPIVAGEAKLGGWVRDVRVVGDVLYAVSEEYDWSYGWPMAGVAMGAGGVAVSPYGSGARVVVSSVYFAGGATQTKGRLELSGWGGVFSVTPNAIVVAHDVPSDPTKQWSAPSGKTELVYVDIRDPEGTIVPRGKLEVNGRVQGWGPDGGRWNVDFADDRFAHSIGCGNVWCGGGDATYVLATVDFADPDAPTVASELTIPGGGWLPAARFDAERLYLSPSDGWNGDTKTPVQIYDLHDASAPKLAGQTTIDGGVWMFVPSGTRLFALGNTWSAGDPHSGSAVSLRYFDVADPSAPHLLGVASFGEGWAWTPAAGTFKAFVKDDAKGLIVLPFSSWSTKDASYADGVQLVEYAPSSIETAGAAHTRGWVERGIFVHDRIVALSDLTLAVVDYSDRDAPTVVKELTLARNVVSAQPQGSTIAELTTDWWGNDVQSSELRVVPADDAEELRSLDASIARATIDGVSARVFRNGDLAYVVSSVRDEVDCPSGGPGPTPRDATSKCWSWTQQVQVVDLSGGGAVKRGAIRMPTPEGSYYGGWGWGWYGCYAWNWFDGADVVQVGGDALVFRRWMPLWDDGGFSTARDALFVVDLRNPDAPAMASTPVIEDETAWWGNMRAVGDTLYLSHYEWVTRPSATPDPTQWLVRYYLDRVDLTDRAHPSIGSRVNVPGMLVGAAFDDPTLLYTLDYRWNDDHVVNELDVVKLDGGVAYLQGSVSIDGWVGDVFVRGNRAYTTAQRYDWRADDVDGPLLRLHQIDLTDPTAPIDRVSSDRRGWGWLLGVFGDRAVVTSGWGGSGVDVYRLQDDAAPTFESFVRTRGWWPSSIQRQGDLLYLSSGYWGVEAIPL